MACCILSGVRADSGGDFCEKLLIPRSLESTSAAVTDGFLSYLDQLLELRVLGHEDIAWLLERLQGGELINPAANLTGVAAVVHGEALAQWLQVGGIERARVQVWAEQRLEKLQTVQAQRAATAEATLRPKIEYGFIHVPAGSFFMRIQGLPVPARLTRDFASMATDVTQSMWVEEFGENPSYFDHPDHPVVNITWWSAVVYANRRSEKMNLSPVYDLSNIQWAKGTSAAAGTLQPASVDDDRKLQINAASGDIYEAKGYRLPTEAEWNYMLSNLGQSQGDWAHDLTEAQLPDYAWYDVNSNGHSHAVGTTPRSLRLNDEEIHDLIGNVWKWMHDRYESAAQGGTDPCGGTLAVNHVICGGSFEEDSDGLASGSRGGMGYGDQRRSSSVGFRLVRTL